MTTVLCSRHCGWLYPMLTTSPKFKFCSHLGKACSGCVMGSSVVVRGLLAVAASRVAGQGF